MSTSVLRKGPGFTPVIDVVAEDVGFVTAAVYGVHWRYCQMHDGVSRAAMNRIAARLGISVKTARRHTQKLCERGYLEDLTPELTHRPHIYCDTGGDIIEGLVQARLDRASSPGGGKLDLASVPLGQRVPPRWTEGPGGLDRESTKDSSKIEEGKKSEKRLFTDLWLMITRVIQGMMTRAMYEAHYWNAEPVRFEGDVLTVAMPSPSSLAATQRLNRLIIPAVEKQCDVRLVFVAEGCDAGVRGSG